MIGEFNCPVCGGWRVVESLDTDMDEDCEYCEATGLNPIKVDLDRWKKAESEFQDQHKATCELSDKTGQNLGRVSLGFGNENTVIGPHTLRIENFLRAKE